MRGRAAPRRRRREGRNRRLHRGVGWPEWSDASTSEFSVAAANGFHPSETDHNLLVGRRPTQPNRILEAAPKRELLRPGAVFEQAHHGTAQGPWRRNWGWLTSSTRRFLEGRGGLKSSMPFLKECPAKHLTQH